jgi:cytochrome P450
MFAAEGLVHKRQRRVATPAFSAQNMRALVPLFFNKGEELKDRWMGLIQEQAIDNSQKNPTGIRLDVSHWMSRATFDIIGLAGQFFAFPRIIHRLTAAGAVPRIRLPLQCHSKRT